MLEKKRGKRGNEREYSCWCNMIETHTILERHEGRAVCYAEGEKEPGGTAFMSNLPPTKKQPPPFPTREGANYITVLWYCA